MTPRTEPGAAAGDVATIRAVLESYADRMRAGDVESIVDLYTDDAVVLGPDMPTAAGRAQLTEVYRGALRAVEMDFRFTFDEVTVRGDTAVARTRTEGKNTVRASGDVVPARYRELFVLYRQHGDWKIGRYMFQPQPVTP